MELILQGNEICFSPTMQEVCDMIISVVYEVIDMFHTSQNGKI